VYEGRGHHIKWSNEHLEIIVLFRFSGYRAKHPSR